MVRHLPVLLVVAILPGAARGADPSAPATPQVATPNPHGSFREDCALCHRAESWTEAMPTAEFDHSRFGFPLDGSHKDVPCLLCHTSLEFAETSGSRCADCHQDVHRGEMGIDCARCHTTRDFIDRAEAVRQHRLGRFPLTGAHLTTDCAACHRPQAGSAMRFAGTAETCGGCHLADYQATRNPDHVAGGYSTDCVRCHSTSSFAGGTFDHSATSFPLTGAHVGVQCAACHGEGPPARVSAECVSCHRAEYDATTSPPHAGTGFPTSCADCHSTSGWSGATFDHDGRSFPIYSGTHRGKWSACVDCHVSPANYTAFECILCHEHSNRSEVDRDHQGESGYAYNSAACYRCHPDGRH